jgi:O-antigen ligase
MTFLYSLFTFLQPGILFPSLAALRPILLLSLIALIVGAIRIPAYPRSTIFGNVAVKYLIGFVLVQVISVYYSGLRSMLDYFLYWYAYIAFIIVSVFLTTSLKDIERFILGMILGGEFIVIYGIYAVFYHLPSSIGGRAGAYGMYENHNDYTFLIIQILPFTYMMMQRSNSSLFKLLLRLMFFSQIFGVLLSQSRGGMVALLLELGLIYVYTTRAKIGLFKIMIMGVIAVGAMAYQIEHRDEEQGSSYTTADAKGSRFELWDAGANMFFTHPFLGVGSQRFGEYSRAYGEISHDNRGKNAHNTYVEIIATTGLLGVFCFYGFIKNSVKQMRELVKIDKTSAVGMYSLATLIAIYSILARAFFDSKTHDWSFYTLCVIAVSLYAYNAHIQKASEVTSEEAKAA